MLIGTGDAGHPARAANPSSLAGKVLRVTDIGRAAAGNPTKGSRVYAAGFRESDGLCVDSEANVAFQTEALRGASPDDPINVLKAGGVYSWPAGASADQSPITSVPQTSRAPGGCAVLGGVLYVTSLDGKAMLAATIKTDRTGTLSLGRFVPSLRGKYGRLRTVVAAPGRRVVDHHVES